MFPLIIIPFPSLFGKLYGLLIKQHLKIKINGPNSNPSPTATLLSSSYTGMNEFREPTKRVTAEADSLTKGKSTALLSFQWKLYIVRSLVLSASTKIMKPEGSDHKKKEIICDF